MKYTAAYVIGRSLIATRQLKDFESNGQRDEIVAHAKRLAPYGKRRTGISMEDVLVWTAQRGWLPKPKPGG